MVRTVAHQISALEGLVKDVEKGDVMVVVVVVVEVVVVVVVHR